MVLGHWIFTGQSLDISPHQITKGLTLEHFMEWIVGSVALGVVVGLVGTIFAYSVARAMRRK
jgi:uncharacterized PurR-regulated membrane protein YhhQ (DUF165 family)